MASKLTESLTEDVFQKCVGQIVDLSDKYHDGWCLLHKEEKVFITKKSLIGLEDPDKKLPDIIVTFEYHVVYHPSYRVPVLAFNIWKQDGTFLPLEEFWQYNSRFKDTNMYETLTQLDHPVLQRPILTLHPCRTQDIIQTFLEYSKNPVISWLSCVGYFVHLKLLKEYLNAC